jgi:uncharacterized protein YaiL (DUF2058 family)
MSESLRDQLLKSGLARTLKPEPAARPPQRPQGPQRSSEQRRSSEQQQRPPRPPGRQPSTREPTPRQPRRESSEIDLAKAYALRDKTEREAREREQRAAEARSREKKERKQKLAALLGGKALNDAAAEIPRHFPHANKIRRIYVTAEQLPRLNAGELAVAQFAGRYLLVSRETGVAAQAIDPDALVLLCDAQATDEDGVPADLVW